MAFNDNFVSAHERKLRERLERVKLAAQDENGLSGTNAVKFTVEFLPWPTALSIRIGSDDLLEIHGVFGELQESSDLVQWTKSELPVEHPVRVVPNEKMQFYRARY